MPKYEVRVTVKNVSNVVQTVQHPEIIHIHGAGTGNGDMVAAIYDPTGHRKDAFNVNNMYGVLDAGTFN